MILSLTNDLKSYLTIFCDVKSLFSLLCKGFGSWKGRFKLHVTSNCVLMVNRLMN
jgi:hypothetical protein